MREGKQGCGREGRDERVKIGRIQEGKWRDKAGKAGDQRGKVGFRQERWDERRKVGFRQGKLGQRGESRD